MSAPAIQERMLDRLPPAWQDGPHIRALMATLAAELAQGELGVLALLRSRQVALAAAWKRDDPARSELGRLGDLIGLAPGPDEQPRDFRVRMARFLAIHRDGLGTADAILRLAALEYRALDEPLLKTEAGSGRRVATFQVSEGRGRRETVRLELEDNPPRVQIVALNLRRGELQKVEQGGLDAVLPEIRLRAEEGDLQFPVLHLGHRGPRLLYCGTLAAGSELRLRHQRPPELDGRVAPLPVFTLDGQAEQGARWDDAELGARVGAWSHGVLLSPLAHGEHALSWSQAPGELVDGLLGTVTVQSTSGDGLFFDDPAARFTERADRGPGARFADGGTENTTQNENVVSRIVQQISLELRWVGREPATFSLYIPAGYVPPRFRASPSPLAALAEVLRRALDHGRAAGVRARLVASFSGPRETIPLADPLTPRASLNIPEPATPELNLSGAVALAIGEDLAIADHVGREGQWDQALLDIDFFAPPRLDAMYGESLFGQARLVQGGVGILGSGLFGASRLTDVPDGVFGRSAFGKADFGAAALPRLGRMVFDQNRFPEAEGESWLDAAQLDLTALGQGVSLVLDRTRLEAAELAFGRPAILKNEDGSPHKRKRSFLGAVEFPTWPALVLCADDAAEGGRLDHHSLSERAAGATGHGVDDPPARLSERRLNEITFA